MRELRDLVHSAHHLLVFEAAARHASFTHAAAELNVSQPAVSLAIRQLEQALGVTLFTRGHRAVSLTYAGETFHQEVSAGLGRILTTAKRLHEDSARRHITVSGTTAFATYWMLPRLARFRADHPDIDLRLETTDRDITLSTDGNTLGVLRGRDSWQAYDSTPIAAERIVAVASPAYLAANGRPRSVTELRAHKLIHFIEPYRPCPDWKQWFASFDAAPYAIPPERLLLNDYALVLQSVMEGQGIALGWRHLTDRLIEGGLLEQVLVHELRTDAAFHLVWPRGVALSAEVDAIRSWMIAEGEGSE